MIGALLGDYVGSRFEWNPHKSTKFEFLNRACRFTDDSILTLAVADAILSDGDYAKALHRWGNDYPRAGYGGKFQRWLLSRDTAPYGSFGNGSAMRVSPVGWAFDDEGLMLAEAARSASATHDHPEGVKGAQAVACAIHLARHGADRQTLEIELTQRFDYELHVPIQTIRPGYAFDVTCQGSVPAALRCALEAHSLEDAIRLAVSLGGDADTQACIAGSVAEARFGPPDAKTRAKLVKAMDRRQNDVFIRFQTIYN